MKIFGLVGILLYCLTPAVGQETLNMDIFIDTNGFSKEKITLTTFRFYLTDIQMIQEEQIVGTHSPVLIDIDSGALHTLRFGSYNPKKSKTLAFVIGTDSLLNTSGILSGALDPIHGMFWAWNTGYINIKLEGSIRGKPFEYHIGGYQSPYSTSREVVLPFVEGNKTTISFHLLDFFTLAQETNLHVLIPGNESSELADRFLSTIKINDR